MLVASPLPLVDTKPCVSVQDLPEDTVICACKQTTKGEIARAVCNGHASLASLGHETAAGTGPGCTTCLDQLGQLIAAYKPHGPGNPLSKNNKVETVKLEKDGLDCLDDIERHAATGNWEEMTEDDKHRFKWYGVFFRKQTPGNFMMRLRSTCGYHTSEQLRDLVAFMGLERVLLG